MRFEDWMTQTLTRVGKPPPRPIQGTDDWLPDLLLVVDTIIERIEALEKLHASK